MKLLQSTPTETKREHSGNPFTCPKACHTRKGQRYCAVCEQRNRYQGIEPPKQTAEQQARWAAQLWIETPEPYTKLFQEAEALLPYIADLDKNHADMLAAAIRKSIRATVARGEQLATILENKDRQTVRLSPGNICPRCGQYKEYGKRRCRSYLCIDMTTEKRRLLKANREKEKRNECL